jgi:hypothetical protein
VRSHALGEVVRGKLLGAGPPHLLGRCLTHLGEGIAKVGGGEKVQAGGSVGSPYEGDEGTGERDQ